MEQLSSGVGPSTLDAGTTASAQAIFSQGSRCSRVVCRLPFFFPLCQCSVVLLLGAQCPMPKGWSKAPVLDGWVQIVRGPRPKSETWPRAKKHAHPPGKPKSHSSCSSSSAKPSARASCCRRSGGGPQVGGGSASSWWREHCSREASRRGVEGSRAKSPVPPVSERLTSCRNFLERARKRVTRAEDLIAKAVEWKTVFMQEVAEAEERLKQLEAEESKPMPPSEPGVMELQRRIEELVRE